MKSIGSDIAHARFVVDRALLLHEDCVDEQALLTLSQSLDSDDRQKAATAVFRSKLCAAANALLALIQEQGFISQAEVNLLSQLAAIGKTDLPLIQTMKSIGLRRVAAGDFESAIQHLEQAQGTAAQSSSRGTVQARYAMNFLNDREIDAGYAQLASMVQLARHPVATGGSLKCVLVVSGIVDENPATPFAFEVAKGIREVGLEVRVLNTGFTRASGSKAVLEFERAKIPVDSVPPGTYEQRLRFVADFFLQHGPQAAFYLVFPMDGLAKIMECLALAPAQLHNCVLYEPYCGKFEYVLFNNEIQLKTAHDRARARYVGSGAFLAERIDNEAPLGREALGIPRSGTLFGTSGRLAKCCGPYLDATIAILKERSASLLAFAGPSYGGERDLLEQAYRFAGVGERVFFLGQRQHEIGRILKSFDVYLDSFPEGGGQALFEAMRCKIPIVAMRDVYFPENGPEIHYSFAGERLGPIVELADPFDVEAYVRIALKYEGSPEARREDGERILERSKRAYDPREAVLRMALLTKEAAERYR